MESEIQMAIVQVAWATVEFYELLVRRLSKQSSMPKSSPFQNFWKHQEKEKDKKDSSRSTCNLWNVYVSRICDRINHSEVFFVLHLRVMK